MSKSLRLHWHSYHATLRVFPPETLHISIYELETTTYVYSVQAVVTSPTSCNLAYFEAKVTEGLFSPPHCLVNTWVCSGRRIVGSAVSTEGVYLEQNLIPTFGLCTCVISEALVKVCVPVMGSV